MRIAVLIIGLLLGLGMFIQAFLVNVLGEVADDEASAGAGAIGVLAALCWLVGAAFVMAFPRFSMVVFVLASLCAFAAAGEFPDMAFWGVLSLVLAVMSFFGWRGKRKQQAKERERDELIRAGAQAQVALAAAQANANANAVPCPACGAMNSVGARFCGSCGRTLAQVPATP